MSASVRPIRPLINSPQLMEAMRQQKIKSTADDQTTLLLDEVRELSTKLERTIAALDNKTTETNAGHTVVLVEEMQKIDEKVEVVALALAERIGTTLTQIEGAVDEAVAELNKSSHAIKDKLGKAIDGVAADVSGSDSKLVHIEALLAHAHAVTDKAASVVKDLGARVDAAVKQSRTRNDAVKKAIATAAQIQVAVTEVATREAESKIDAVARETDSKLKASMKAIGELTAAQIEVCEKEAKAQLGAAAKDTASQLGEINDGLKSLSGEIDAPVHIERDSNGKAIAVVKGGKRYAVHRNKLGRITGMK